MIRLDVLGGLSLRGPESTDLRGVLAQPKRLALLVYLALTRPGNFARRDTLLALFWPELDTERARRALRQSLYHLRRCLGADALITRGAEEVAVNTAALSCDVVAFRAALETGRAAEALAIYRGDLLPGFFIADASPELEHWLERERAALRDAAGAGSWQLAENAEAAGDTISAAQWARRGADLAHGDEVTVRRLITMLVRLRDHAGALHAYALLRSHLAKEFSAEPAPQTTELVAALRNEAVRQGVTPLPGAYRATPIALPAHLRPTADERPRWRIAGFAAAGVVGLIALVVALTPVVRGAAAGPPVVAVGWIEARTPAGDSAQAAGLPDLITTSLSRVPRLQMLTRGRLYDVKARLQLGVLDSPTLREAARQAGATELVEGELYRTIDNQFRLDLRRLALANGRVLQAASEAGTELLDVVDRATAALAGGLGYSAPRFRLAAATDAQVVARRFFDEGLRAYYQNDYAGARGLLQAALRADSTLAMAAYYLMLSEHAIGGAASKQQDWWNHALRMADGASDQDRLIIKSTWATANMDPAAVAYAETLAVRYPSLPQSQLQMGLALIMVGDLTAALPWFRRAFDMDSAGMSRELPACVACDAQASLFAIYIDLDSIDAAAAIAQRWVRLAPQQADAWWALVVSLERNERYDEAIQAVRDAGPAFKPVHARLLEQQILIRAGRFAEADRGLRELIVGGEPLWRVDAFWWLNVSLRMQGRLREAFTVADEFRVVADSAFGSSSGIAPESHAVARAVTFLEAGDGRRAAPIFEAISTGPSGATPTANARNRTWFLAHTASALAVAGDTAGLRALSGRVERSGSESGYGRDRLLHYYVRGLERAAAGHPEQAIVEFRRNRLSYMYGLATYHEAKALLALGRPREAIPMLRRLLRRNLETGNFYLSFTTVRALLGDAYADAGLRDSAAVQYRWALAAWRQAEGNVATRAQAVREKLAGLRPSVF